MLKTDCVHFPGNRPCYFNKHYGIACDNCNHYQSIDFKILIIKLDALGDVLRTTAILPPLKEKYPDSYITWCTKSNATQIFNGNDFVNEVLSLENDAMYRLGAEEFDLVINLDNSKISAAIASKAKSKEKIGYLLNKKGYITPTSEFANQWLEMSAFDDVKKKNDKTYQQRMYDILNIDSKVSIPILKVPEVISRNVELLINQWNLKNDSVSIGLNLGVGEKWPSKAWPMQNWEELVLLLKNESFNLMLLGGPDEKEKMERLKNNFDFLINTGSSNSVMEFTAIIKHCDIIITADTLALHIATALGKKIIAFFGPTSASEIELYGKGIKMISPKKCSCFYNKTCTESVPCLAEISASDVFNEIKSFAN